jgi:pimeloyl-ACP methyl ester carboxylesterase
MRCHQAGKRLTVAVSVVLALAGCGGSTTGTLAGVGSATAGADNAAAAHGPGPAAAAPAGDAFYDPPNPLPAGRPGDVLWSRPWVAVAGARTTLVLYRSTDVRGEPVAVSGVVAVPAHGSAPAGGWPVLDWAHGTTGLADSCAPSRAPKTLGTDLLGMIKAFIGRGFAVVATDYQGLGTPGVHQYMVGQTEGRGVLDMARAAARLPGDGILGTSPVVVWGHSQGGGASAFAAELQPTYAPDVHLKGAVVGSPAAELRTLLGTDFAHNSYVGFVLLARAGYQAAYPGAALGNAFTAAGSAAVDTATKGCADAFLAATGKQNPSRYLAADVGTTEPFASLLEANTPGNIATPVPMFVYQGDHDEIVPVTISQQLVARMCAHGGFTVHREVLAGKDHGQALTAALPDVLTWITDRLAALPPPTDCP